MTQEQVTSWFDVDTITYDEESSDINYHISSEPTALYSQLFVNHCSYRLPSIQAKASMRCRRKQICQRQPEKQGRKWDPNRFHHLLCSLSVCCLTEPSTIQRQKTNNDTHTTLHITVCQRLICSTFILRGKRLRTPSPNFVVLQCRLFYKDGFRYYITFLYTRSSLNTLLTFTWFNIFNLI